MSRLSRILTVVLPLMVVGGLLVAMPASAALTSPVQARTESLLSDRDGIKTSYVNLLDPMPAGTPAHSTACDSIGYLRYRVSDGPADPVQADVVVVVVVSQQGVFGNATNSESVARNSVRSAKVARSVPWPRFSFRSTR
jgi:hypothetical protein